ncbi:MAG: DUF2865 domain-containing protein [Bauldia sp.]
MATIGQMQANLQRLMSEQAQMGGGDAYDLAAQRSGLLRALADNHCSGAYVAGEPPPDDNGGGNGLFSSLFGTHSIFNSEDDSSPADSGFGTYRTLCVRTCDGFYFPISFSTVPGQFSTDRRHLPGDVPGRAGGALHPPQPGRGCRAGGFARRPAVFGATHRLQVPHQYDKSCTCHTAGAAVGAPAFTQFPTGDSGLSPVTGAPLDPGDSDRHRDGAADAQSQAHRRRRGPGDAGRPRRRSGSGAGGEVRPDRSGGRFG